MSYREPHQKRPRRVKNKELSQFARYVKDKRIAMGITQKDLAEIAGVSYGFIQDIERGLVNLRLSKVLDLINALGGAVEINDRVVNQATLFNE